MAQLSAPLYMRDLGDAFRPRLHLRQPLHRDHGSRSIGLSPLFPTSLDESGGVRVGESGHDPALPGMGPLVGSAAQRAVWPFADGSVWQDYLGPVLRVYLDQNKWIDLARAATGHPLGARFVDALDAARAAVAAEEASLPLDLYRYEETGKRRDDRSRRALADLMFDLSRQHTMARSHDLLPAEIDCALKRRFGRPEDPRRQHVFGEGLTHMTGGDVRRTPFDASGLPDEIPFRSPEGRAELERIYNRLVEREVLRIGPDEMRGAGFDPEGSSFAQRFVDFENSIGDAIREQGLSGALLEVAVRASDLGGIRTAVADALERIGITWNDFIDRSTPADLVSFMDDLPTRHVTNVMRAAKLRQTQQRWEKNDFNDIVSLPVAAVYCDVVITEKQWVHRLRQGRVDRRYHTRLLSDTSQLVEVLDRANHSPSRSLPADAGEELSCLSL